MENDPKATKSDEFNGHDVQPYNSTSGPCRWICGLCFARAEDKDFFRKYVCSGQPDVVGGG